jgi:SAM-dependent methyltransferase
VTGPVPALSFGQVAPAYDRIRPSYPIEAVHYALGPDIGPGRGTVVDLGAGTGLLTRVVRPLCATVIPVEPDAKMRAQLMASTPGVEAIAGAAEAIPLPDESVDAAVCGQSYHWFDAARAHPEIARVLRPGGTLGPIWNLRDETVDWVAELGRIAEPARTGDRHGYLKVLEFNFGPLFAPGQRAHFRHEVQMDADGLVALIASRSYYLVAPPDQRARIEANVRGLAAQLPPRFALPYVTVCFRTTKL